MVWCIKANCCGSLMGDVVSIGGIEMLCFVPPLSSRGPSVDSCIMLVLYLGESHHVL
uniref:Uncharacterized protein n=1 Tax=Gadus morhua TaxID=8049 RepID=A0A8C5B0K5_GADMO